MKRTKHMKKNTSFTFSEKWNLRFMDLAKSISTWSKDESTKVGCVIVGPDKEIRSMGYNGFPRGVNDGIAERHLRPAKYQYTEHAERNAIYNTTYYGGSVRGCTAFITLPPCVDCARAIIQSGIKEVIFLVPDESSDKSKIPGWRDTIKTSLEIFDESGVHYKALNKPLIKGHSSFPHIMNLINPVTLDNLSKELIAKNGLEFQILLCVEEFIELETELILNNSLDNIAAECADALITLNHVTYGYNIKQDVANLIDKKILNHNFLTNHDTRTIAMLNLQKELLKNINRKENNIDRIVNQTADAYITVGKTITDTTSLTRVRDFAKKKILRTIQRNQLTK